MKWVWGNKRLGGPLAVAALALATVTSQASTFGDDVNSAIDLGLQYARNTNQFTTNTGANGLTLLALLDKTRIPAGYAGLDASDKVLADASACILMNHPTIWGGQSNYSPAFYAYGWGQTMMALARYATTGGPDVPTGALCSGKSVRATLDLVVDQTLVAQSNGTNGGCVGMWVYSGPGCDSSTTQFAAGGLAAAKNFYGLKGDPGSRIGPIQTALDRTATAYATHGKTSTGSVFDASCGGNCGASGSGTACWGHGYQQNYGAPGSHQQTSSGLWLQLLGTGKNINSQGVQNYLKWEQSAYHYSTNAYWESWPPAYFYYLWSSAKAYDLIEQAGVPPDAGNLGPGNVGTLSTACGREANQDPAALPQIPRWGSNPAPYYAGFPKGWYFDYAYRLLGLQQNSGQFYNPNGSWNAAVDHAYALLVLVRSTGGITTTGGRCDVNKDGLINKSDLAIIQASVGQTVAAGDPRDANKDLKINIIDLKMCTLQCTYKDCH